MAPKIRITSQALTSSTPPTQDTPSFPNYRFFTEAHTKIYIKVKYYKLISERVFDVEEPEVYEEFIIMLEERGVRFNSMIKETNKYIGLELYANDALCPFKY